MENRIPRKAIFAASWKTGGIQGGVNAPLPGRFLHRGIRQEKPLKSTISIERNAQGKRIPVLTYLTPTSPFERMRQLVGDEVFNAHLQGTITEYIKKIEGLVETKSPLPGVEPFAVAEDIRKNRIIYFYKSAKK